MTALFVDTGAFLAKEIAADQHHDEAATLWRRLEQSKALLFSSEHVLDETATLLSRRTSYAFAAGWGQDVLSSGIEWLPTEPADGNEAFLLMRKYADQAVSFTDCVSFILMKRPHPDLFRL